MYMSQLTRRHQQRRSCLNVNSVGDRWDDTAKLLRLCFVYFPSTTAMLSSVIKEESHSKKCLYLGEWVISLDMLALVSPQRAEAERGHRLFWFLWCIYTVGTSWMFNQRPTNTQPPNHRPFLSPETAHGHGEGPWFWHCVQLLYEEHSVCEDWYMWVRFCKSNTSNFNKIGQYSIFWSMSSGVLLSRRWHRVGLTPHRANVGTLRSF